MPAPDSVCICQQIGDAVTPLMLENPQVTRLAIDTHAKVFPKALCKYLDNVSFLCIPLLPAEGQLIGLIILYRKGEQPLTDEEVSLAQIIAPAVAVSVQHSTTNRDDEAAA